MRKILVFTVIVFTGLLLRAQQEDLVNNTWYLQKVIINDVEFIQPFNAESTDIITAYFADNKIYTHAMCNWIESDTFTGISNTEISTDGFAMSLVECSMSENTNFENAYFGVFFNVSNIDETFSPFNYTIEDENTHKKLIVTNIEGSQAIYISVNLSVEDIGVMQGNVQIYPNPTQGYLYVKTEGFTGSLTLKMINWSGQEILQQDIVNKNSKIDITGLEKGEYICLIMNDKKEIMKSEKIIKK